MKRELQGQYIKISTVGEKAQAFVPAPLPPAPPIEWSSKLRDNACLRALEQLGIVKEISGQKRNRLYAYSEYIRIMSEGTELPH